MMRGSIVIHAVAVTLAVSACASGGAAASGSSDFSYGYMIPGPRVASAFGIAATDTLPEITARTTLPTTLLNAISQEVAQGNFNNRCTRRFGGPRVYALIFHRSCDSSVGPDADPVAIVGFAPDGRKIGTVAWQGASTITLIVPARRF
jgi:hypothetical protein